MLGRRLWSFTFYFRLLYVIYHNLCFQLFPNIFMSLLFRQFCVQITTIPVHGLLFPLRFCSPLEISSSSSSTSFSRYFFHLLSINIIPTFVSSCAKPLLLSFFLPFFLLFSFNFTIFLASKKDRSSQENLNLTNILY